MWNARTDTLFEDIEQEIHRQRAQALARRAYAERVIKETGHLPIATESPRPERPPPPPTFAQRLMWFINCIAS